MKQAWGVAFRAVPLVFLAGALLWAPVLAKPNEPDPEKTKAKDNPAWKDSTINGIVQATSWVPAKQAGQWTATIVVWSNESDLAISVFGDDPTVRDAIANGTACV